jgi:predicted DCC family thiol-disulfide oxidoreductase YuxK
MTSTTFANATSSAEAQPILLYDGTCGFCARSVQFVLQREREPRTLRFAALEGALGSRVRGEHPSIAGVDSVVWYEPGADGRAARLLMRSDAALAVLASLGGVWRALASVGRLVPRTVRDAIYDFIARNRYRIAGRDTSCLLPTPEQRARFLD